MGRRWKPSIADQLEDAANSLLDAAYTVARSPSSSGRTQPTEWSVTKSVKLGRGSRLNFVRKLRAGSGG